jgi:hypothetical protein
MDLTMGVRHVKAGTILTREVRVYTEINSKENVNWFTKQFLFAKPMNQFRNAKFANPDISLMMKANARSFLTPFITIVSIFLNFNAKPVKMVFF